MRIDAPEITGSLIVSGSISISGSLNLNGSNVSSGNGGTVSPGTISGSSQISALGFVSASVTGSSLISASIAGNTITLNKGNGATLAITLPDGSVPTNITALNTFTASVSTSVGLLQSYTASVSTSVGLLQSTASYLNTTFSASVDSRLNSGGGSTDISALNIFTASLAGTNQFTASLSGTNQFTASLSGTNLFTASVNTSITSLNSYTQSNEQRITNINTATGSLFISTSVSLTTASFSSNTLTFTKGNGTQFGIVIPDISSSAGTISGSTQISGLGFINATQTSSMNVNSASYALTASYALNSGLSINTGNFATTGSNTFTGNQTVTGSVSVSGSLRGIAIPATYTLVEVGVSVSQSMDFSKSNFFTFNMAPGPAVTRIAASNIQPGQTVSLKIETGSPVGTASFSPAFKFPSGSAYTASAANQTDIITFITYDTQTVFASSVKNMI